MLYKINSLIIPFVKRIGNGLILLSIISSAYGQGLYPILTTTEPAEVWFDKIVNPESAAIINGPEYYVPFRAVSTHPFYQKADSDLAVVQYDNDLYRNVNLLYDIYGDILVLKSFNVISTFFIKMDKNLVQSFDLHGHHFKKYNEGIDAGIGTYFDVLFEGKQFAVLVKRRKILKIESLARNYLEDDFFYILNNGKWIRITGKNSFFKTLIKKDQRKELSNFMKTNHINLRKRRDDDLKKIGAFCYSLKEKK